MEIRRVPVSKLNPAAYNPRKDLQPGDAEYQKLARSLDQFGCVEPVVWNERTGNVVGGHQRLKILLAAGETELDVSVVNLSDADEKALNIALNKIAGEWDTAALTELLQELSENSSGRAGESSTLYSTCELVVPKSTANTWLAGPAWYSLQSGSITPLQRSRPSRDAVSIRA